MLRDMYELDKNFVAGEIISYNWTFWKHECLPSNSFQ